MLFNLSIENVALIKKADVNFGTGFNVLTGETGAGKSILIGSVNMLLGERIGRDIIRNGENYAYVEGLFYLTPETVKLLETLDVTADEEGCLIVSRRLFLDGKNICKAGGKTVPVSKLREIGQCLINVHGQHDNQALLNSASHVSFLDASVRDSEKDTFHEFDKVYAALGETEKKRSALDIDETERLRRIDVLNYEINEINEAALCPGEEEELKATRSIVKNKETIQENCSLALDMLYENSEGVCAYNFLSQAQRAVEACAQSGAGLDDVSEKMAEFLYGLEDIVGIIHEKLEQAGTGEFSLDEIEERLDLIYRLKRKYGNSEEEILEYGQRAEVELETIQTSETRKTEMEETIKKLLAKANELAKTNRGKRQKAAKIIETKINAELSELNMEGAKFSVHFEPCALCKNGMDKVEFLLSANQGEPPKSLAKIVSGGELSRIMLALKNVLVAGDAAGTLIFDEIDSGISGRAAGKVGIKLGEISEKKQVLCVTHLPQIASLSEHHFKISKLQENNRTNTTIQLLNQQEKISEIALMIGGDNVTETTVAQAAEMIRKGKQGGEK